VSNVSVALGGNKCFKEHLPYLRGLSFILPYELEKKQNKDRPREYNPCTHTPTNKTGETHTLAYLNTNWPKGHANKKKKNIYIYILFVPT
jgi:hypothetical protein